MCEAQLDDGHTGRSEQLGEEESAAENKPPEKRGTERKPQPQGEPEPADGPSDDIANPLLARQVARIRQPGRWGHLLDLHLLGVMTGRRIAVCLPEGSDDQAGFRVLDDYGEGPEAPTSYLVNNAARTHWWALRPAQDAADGPDGPDGPDTPDAQARVIVGHRVDCGAEGDCMYYAFLATLGPDLMPLRNTPEAQEHRVARAMMLHLRHRLAARLIEVWHTPLSELTHRDEHATLAELYALSEI